MEEFDFRFGKIAQLYYEIANQKVPCQMDLLDEWFPGLMILTDSSDGNTKTGRTGSARRTPSGLRLRSPKGGRSWRMKESRRRGQFRTVYSLNVIFGIHFLPIRRIS